MTRLKETIVAASPPSIALAAIERYIVEHANLLQLTVPLHYVGLDTGLELGRGVEVSFESHPNRRLVGRQPDRIELTWAPVGGGPYPNFTGTLIARPFGTQTELELNGSYKPPFGAVGKTFDAVLGKKIAHATAQAFLENLRAVLELDYASFKEAAETAPGHTANL
ncbi:MAG: hypothetical protein JO263_00860 [Candidatus Eremiobacteraeota bacterium]|nr:hypothetical protein [Candidatus Eremiobacteraeota bacterium]